MKDLEGKVVLVTGANSGIGLEACVKLATRGAKLVMVGRDEKKLDAAIADVKKRSGATEVDSLMCDFSSQESVRALAAAYRKKYSRLDILVNNAGSVSDSRKLTVDGLEQTFAVNHLGYFLLTNLLLDLLKSSAPSRIVIVSSTGHYSGDMDFDDLQMEKGYSIMRAYKRSKLGNVLYTRELAKRLEGTGVIVNSLHPGAVSTNIWAHAPWYAQPVLAIARLFMISPEQGGDTIVHLAASPDIEGKTGGYYEKNKLQEPSDLAKDDAIAKRLWTESEKLTTKSTEQQQQATP